VCSPHLPLSVSSVATEGTRFLPACESAASFFDNSIRTWRASRSAARSAKRASRSAARASRSANRASRSAALRASFSAIRASFSARRPALRASRSRSRASRSTSLTAAASAATFRRSCSITSHRRFSHGCRSVPSPPNLVMSRQNLHLPQFIAVHLAHTPQRMRFVPPLGAAPALFVAWLALRVLFLLGEDGESGAAAYSNRTGAFGRRRSVCSGARTP